MTVDEALDVGEYGAVHYLSQDGGTKTVNPYGIYAVFTAYVSAVEALGEEVRRLRGLIGEENENA